MALASLLRMVLRYAPRGLVGTIGYALALLAAFTGGVGQFAARGQLTVADCSGPALNEVLQLVAIGQAFSATVVIAIGIGLEWKVWQAEHAPAAGLDLGRIPLPLDTPESTTDPGGEE